MSPLVFSINSGRSGSDYLFRLLSTAGNGAAYHEPSPSMAGSRMSRVPAHRPTLFDRAYYVPMYAKKYSKVLAIRRTIKELPPGDAYIETNHMFILTFYDVIMNHFRGVNVVLLRRYLPWVVKSFLDLNMFTPEDSKTKYWTSSPNSPSAAVRALAPDDEMDQVDRCIAYVIDIEARAQRFKQQYPQATVVEKRLPDLNEREHVEELFEQLKLTITPETWNVVGQVYNNKSDDKQSDFSEAYCRDRILQYIEKCESKGVLLPDLPHMNDQYRGHREVPRATGVS